MEWPGGGYGLPTSNINNYNFKLILIFIFNLKEIKNNY